MKRIMYLLTSLSLIMIMVSCSNVLDVTDVKEIEPIPDGYGRVNLVLPGSGVGSRGISGLTEAIENTRKYSIQVISNEYSRFYYPEVGDDISIIMPVGIYDIQIMALDGLSDNTPGLLGLGYVFGIEVHSGIDTNAYITILAIKSELSVSSNMVDPGDTITVTTRLDMRYHSDFFDLHNMSILSTPKLELYLLYTTIYGGLKELKYSPSTELYSTLLEAQTEIVIPEDAKPGDDIRISFGECTDSLSFYWNDYTREGNTMLGGTARLSRLLTTEGMIKEAITVNEGPGSVSLIVGWETE